MIVEAASQPVDSLRGWRVVLGAFLVLMAGWCAIYSYAAFACDLAPSFGASQASLSLIYALSGGSCFLVGAVAGPLADRIGARWPAAGGMIAAGLGLTLAGQAASIPELWLSYGLLLGSGVGLAYVPAMAAVQCWFVKHRGLASGLAAMGIGVGAALVPLVANTLSSLGDWRIQLPVFGLGVVVVGLSGALLLDGASERRGLRPDASGLEGPPLAMIRQSPAFARLYLGTLLVSVPAAMPFAHMVAFAEEAGIAREDAVILIALIGLGSIAGRVLLGAMADRIGRHTAYLGCCMGLSCATMVWSLAGSAMLQAFALVFGLFQGGFVALCPAVVVDQFGRRAAAGATGLLHTGRAIAILLGPPGAAFLAAGFGGLTIPLAGTALLGLLGCAVLSRMPAKRARLQQSSGSARDTMPPTAWPGSSKVT